MARGIRDLLGALTRRGNSVNAADSYMRRAQQAQRPTLRERFRSVLNTRRADEGSGVQWNTREEQPPKVETIEPDYNRNEGELQGDKKVYDIYTREYVYYHYDEPPVVEVPEEEVEEITVLISTSPDEEKTVYRKNRSYQSRINMDDVVADDNWNISREGRVY